MLVAYVIFYLFFHCLSLLLVEISLLNLHMKRLEDVFTHQPSCTNIVDAN